MTKWSFYAKETGIFTGVKYSGIARMLDLNTPIGCGAIEGHIDHQSHRVDLDVLKSINALDAEKDEEQIASLQSKLVIDYEPPQPSDDHEWNAGTKRWQFKPELVARQRDIANAKQEIAKLEISQHRAMREFSIGIDGAADRLKAIDDQIAIQRKLIQVNS